MKEIRENLTGKWTIHWAPLFILLPISVLIEPVIRAPAGQDFAFFTITSFLGYLTMLAYLAAVWFFLYRKNSPHWLVIFPVSALAGFVLSQSIDFYNRLFNLSEVSNFGIDSTVMVWTVGLPIVGYVMNKLNNFVETRDSLVARLLDLDKPKLVFSLDDEFRELLTSRNSIDQQGYQRLAEKLKEFTDTEVRPLSHKMWVSDVQTRAKFPFLSLVRLALTNNPIPAFLYSVLALWLVAVNAVQRFGLIDGLIYTLVDLVVFIAVLAIFKKIPVFASGSNAFLFPAVASTLMVGARTFIRPEMSLEQFLIGWLVLLLWLFTSLVFTGGVVEAIKTQRQVLSELESDLQSGQRLSYLQQEIQNRGSGDLAKFIHGTVQSKLMAFSLRLKQAVENGDVQQAIETREAAKRLIENPLAEYRPRSNKPIVETFEELKKSWRGLVDVEISFESIDASQWQAVEEIVSEGITNAHKHGFARNVHVSIANSENAFHIEITDDGIGPRQSKDGYGLRMIDTQTSGNWSFGPSDDGRGSTLRASLPVMVIND